MFKKIIAMFVMTSIFYVSSQFLNISEAVAVDTGTYIVFTESIKLERGIWQVTIRYPGGRGTPMFIQFKKINGDWKHRDAAGGYDWRSVSDSQAMNDVLYVVLHSDEYE